MRPPGLQLRAVLLAVVLLFLAGCGSDAGSPDGPATRDPLSPTDQASVQLTEEQAKALEAACSKGEAVPGVSECPEAVRKVAMEAKGSCTAQSEFCMTIAAGDGTVEAPPGADTAEPKTTLVTVSCPADSSRCSDLAPALTDGQVLQESKSSLMEPGADTSTSSPESTEPAPETTEPAPAESSPTS